MVPRGGLGSRASTGCWCGRTRARPTGPTRRTTSSREACRRTGGPRALPLPDGGATFGGAPWKPGDTKFPQPHPFISDGTRFWRLHHDGGTRQWWPYDPATGTATAGDPPEFLADPADQGPAHRFGDLVPAPEEFAGSPLGYVDGLVGWKVSANPDGSRLGTRIDGREVVFPAGIDAAPAPGRRAAVPRHRAPVPGRRRPGGSGPARLHGVHAGRRPAAHLGLAGNPGAADRLVARVAGARRCRLGGTARGRPGHGARRCSTRSWPCRRPPRPPGAPTGSRRKRWPSGWPRRSPRRSSRRFRRSPRRRCARRSCPSSPTPGRLVPAATDAARAGRHDARQRSRHRSRRPSSTRRCCGRCWSTSTTRSGSTTPTAATLVGAAGGRAAAARGRAGRPAEVDAHRRHLAGTARRCRAALAACAPRARHPGSRAGDARHAAAPARRHRARRARRHRAGAAHPGRDKKAYGCRRWSAPASARLLVQRRIGYERLHVRGRRARPDRCVRAGRGREDHQRRRVTWGGRERIDAVAARARRAGAPPWFPDAVDRPGRRLRHEPRRRPRWCSPAAERHSYEANFLPKETRTTLGISATEARSGRDDAAGDEVRAPAEADPRRDARRPGRPVDHRARRGRAWPRCGGRPSGRGWPSPTRSSPRSSRLQRWGSLEALVMDLPTEPRWLGADKAKSVGDRLADLGLVAAVAGLPAAAGEPGARRRFPTGTTGAGCCSPTRLPRSTSATCDKSTPLPPRVTAGKPASDGDLVECTLHPAKLTGPDDPVLRDVHRRPRRHAGDPPPARRPATADLMAAVRADDRSHRLGAGPGHRGARPGRRGGRAARPRRRRGRATTCSCWRCPTRPTATSQRWTGWTPARLKKARAELAATDLVVEAKRERAGRTLFLPGGWLALKTPHLPIEEWKVPLLLDGEDARRRGSPSPCRPPSPRCSAPAWQRVVDGDAPRCDDTGHRRGADDATRRARPARPPGRSTRRSTAYADELAFLAASDDGPRPPGWRLTPRAVVTFIAGSGRRRPRSTGKGRRAGHRGEVRRRPGAGRAVRGHARRRARACCSSASRARPSRCCPSCWPRRSAAPARWPCRAPPAPPRTSCATAGTTRCCWPRARAGRRWCRRRC